MYIKHIFALSCITYFHLIPYIICKQERVEHKYGESIKTTSILMHRITNDDDDDDDLKKYRNVNV